MKTFFRAVSVAALVFGIQAANADEFNPAVVFDMGGKFDKSFNEGVYNGVERFKSETGEKYREFEVTNETQREQAIRKMAQRGSNPVLGIGFAQADAISKVAAEYPDTDFAIIDMVVDQPNVQSVIFKEHEGSFLVGLLAAMKSETGKVGFIGGMDIPLIRKFACGFEQGAKFANPDVEVIQNMTGTTPAAWNDPGKGSELTRAQFDQGVDVVFAAAGGTGVGVLQTAADEGKYSIGVDSNQNHLHPGSVLTSMLKRVDVAAYQVFKSANEGTFEPGFNEYGLAEGGVGWSLDEHNKDLITAEMKEAADLAEADIIAGAIRVHNYMDDSTCTY
ncbi:BMP family lipoprotein [Curvivirga aplysinae]|uniref:BMP family lipoprotein n=1 Tax=Curvivirga aplysinae TaxID=2529852 RepID=UPI0012BC28A8|nr:BMP family ABC transporter substrate-binding protein [Curvivirga aplysinae]MTI10545.1 BMP family ABC transporter substrate-binding protein [Curvivirga aplysinae]